MWHDNESEIDLLDFSYLAEAIFNIAKDDNLLPATIGVFGDWGSGKSTLLNLVKSRFESDQNSVCISFNGWLFEGYEDAKAALMGTILSQLESNKKFGEKVKEKAGDLMNKLIKQVDWISLIGKGVKYSTAFATLGPAGLGIASIADLAAKIAEKSKEKVDTGELEEILKKVIEPSTSGTALRKGIQEFHADFGHLLEKTDIGTLVVFIDDLDRCTPDTVIETLEAIRLFLYVERTVFIIGADERLVKYAVRRQFPQIPGENAEVGRDYLEKLIQFPIRIPQLSIVQIETYINLLFASKLFESNEIKELLVKLQSKQVDETKEIQFNYGIARDILSEGNFHKIEDDLMLSQQISPILANGLNGNPRQCKRFLNTLLLRIEMAKTKGVTLKKRVLSKLMLLEYFRVEWFKKLAAAQSHQNGKSKELKALESTASRPAIDLDSQKADKEFGNLSEWLSDKWTVEWLKSEPKLADTNLTSYFFFSRDQLGQMTGAARRMAPVAQEALAKLLSESDAERKSGLKEEKSLSESDCMAVLEELHSRAAAEDSEEKRENILDTIVRWSGNREALASQSASFLEKYPVAWIPTKLVLLMLDTNMVFFKSGLGLKIVAEWAKSDNKALARIATARLNKKE